MHIVNYANASGYISTITSVPTFNQTISIGYDMRDWKKNPALL